MFFWGAGGIPESNISLKTHYINLVSKYKKHLTDVLANKGFESKYWIIKSFKQKAFLSCKIKIKWYSWSYESL